MDLLYSRYSNPIEFMNLYINQGRFGEFVDSIIQQDKKRKIEAAEKENEDKLFNLYVHSFSDMSFNDWKDKELHKPTHKPTEAHTEEVKKEQVVNIINNSTSILDSFHIEG